MKMLFFLLLPIFIFGQHDSASVLKRNNMLLTVNTLDCYKEYCFNDSSIIYVITVCGWEKDFDYKCPSEDEVLISEYEPCHAKWIHRKPEFDNFMEWLFNSLN